MYVCMYCLKNDQICGEAFDYVKLFLLNLSCLWWKTVSITKHLTLTYLNSRYFEGILKLNFSNIKIISFCEQRY
jgi:hypothetical protein